MAQFGRGQGRVGEGQLRRLARRKSGEIAQALKHQSLKLRGSGQLLDSLRLLGHSLLMWGATLTTDTAGDIDTESVEGRGKDNSCERPSSLLRLSFWPLKEPRPSP